MRFASAVQLPQDQRVGETRRAYFTRTGWTNIEARPGLTDVWDGTQWVPQQPMIDGRGYFEQQRLLEQQRANAPRTVTQSRVPGWAWAAGGAVLVYFLLKD